MVFHRFLNGLDADSLPLQNLALTVNRTPVVGWDPLVPFSTRPERVELGEVRLAQRVRVEYAVLPPEEHLNAQDRKEACLDGRRMTDMQGFYVYRANRLVCFANWLGVPGHGNGHWNKDSSTQLARVAVDITNDVDDDWALDVRKSNVAPPERDRQVLVEVGHEARARSRARIFGRVLKNQQSPTTETRTLWSLDGGLPRIARDHPLVEALLTCRPGTTPSGVRAAIKSLLRQLETSPTLVSLLAEPSTPSSDPPPVSNPQVFDATDVEDAVELGKSLLHGGVDFETVLGLIRNDPRFGANDALTNGLRQRLELGR